MPSPVAETSYFDLPRRSIIARLLSGLYSGSGIQILAGSTGVGKTILLQHLAGEMVALDGVLLLGHSPLISCARAATWPLLLQEFSAGLDLDGSAVTAEALSNTLQTLADGLRTPVVLLDDVDRLGDDDLAQLLALLGQSTARHHLLSAVLAGGTELPERVLHLASDTFSSASSAPVLIVPPMTRTDVLRLINVRWGAAPESPEAQRVADRANGLPSEVVRLWNAPQPSRAVQAGVLIEVGAAPGADFSVMQRGMSDQDQPELGDGLGGDNENAPAPEIGRTAQGIDPSLFRELRQPPPQTRLPDPPDEDETRHFPWRSLIAVTAIIGLVAVGSWIYFAEWRKPEGMGQDPLSLMSEDDGSSMDAPERLAGRPLSDEEGWWRPGGSPPAKTASAVQNAAEADASTTTSSSEVGEQTTGAETGFSPSPAEGAGQTEFVPAPWPPAPPRPESDRAAMADPPAPPITERTSILPVLRTESPPVATNAKIEPAPAAAATMAAADGANSNQRITSSEQPVDIAAASTAESTPASATPAAPTPILLPPAPPRPTSVPASAPVSTVTATPPQPMNLSQATPRARPGESSSMRPTRESASTGALLLSEGDERRASGDVNGARDRYRQANAAGNRDAAFRIAQTFDPRMLPTDQRAQQARPAEAAQWYQDAARRGDSRAAAQLHELTEWLQQAAAAGDSNARRALETWPAR